MERRADSNTSLPSGGGLRPWDHSIPTQQKAAEKEEPTVGHVISESLGVPCFVSLGTG